MGFSMSYFQVGTVQSVPPECAGINKIKLTSPTEEIYYSSSMNCCLSCTSWEVYDEQHFVRYRYYHYYIR